MMLVKPVEQGLSIQNWPAFKAKLGKAGAHQQKERDILLPLSQRDWRVLRCVGCPAKAIHAL
jgi:hypothetical protein